MIGVLGAAIAACAFSGVAQLMTPDPEPARVAARDETAVSFATIVANDFVNASDTRVPASADVDALFSRQSGLPGAKVTFAGSLQTRIGDQTLVTLETSTFHVTVPEGEATRLYELTVPMALSANGWLLAAAPTIEPLTVATPTGIPQYDDLFANGGSQSDLAALSYGPQVTEQVKRWAAAFAAGGVASPDLFAITQDNDASHSYDGLGGWALQNVEIKSFTQGPNGTESAKRFGSTWMTVRVALVIAPPASNGPTLKSEYDLLLQPELNPASPPVTAWGPAGVGPTSLLTNYVNNTNG